MNKYENQEEIKSNQKPVVDNGKYYIISYFCAFLLRVRLVSHEIDGKGEEK